MRISVGNLAFVASFVAAFAIAGYAAVADVPPTITQFEITGVMVDLGYNGGHTVITQDPQTAKIGYVAMKDVPVYADVQPGQPMYAVTCDGGMKCKGKSAIHIHGRKDIIGGAWETHDYLNMHHEPHRLATLE